MKQSGGQILVRTYLRAVAGSFWINMVDVTSVFIHSFTNSTQKHEQNLKGKIHKVCMDACMYTHGLTGGR